MPNKIIFIILLPCILLLPIFYFYLGSGEWFICSAPGAYSDYFALNLEPDDFIKEMKVTGWREGILLHGDNNRIGTLVKYYKSKFTGKEITVDISLNYKVDENRQLIKPYSIEGARIKMGPVIFIEYKRMMNKVREEINTIPNIKNIPPINGVWDRSCDY